MQLGGVSHCPHGKNHYFDASTSKYLVYINGTPYRLVVFCSISLQKMAHESPVVRIERVPAHENPGM